MKRWDSVDVKANIPRPCRRAGCGTWVQGSAHGDALGHGGHP